MDVLLSARREMRCTFTRSDPEIRQARWITALTLGLANICGAAITFAIAVLAFPTSRRHRPGDRHPRDAPLEEEEGNRAGGPARFCELAKDTAGRLLVDAASVEAAGDDERAHWESRGEVELRGRGRTAAVYAPVAPTRSAAPVS